MGNVVKTGLNLSRDIAKGSAASCVSIRCNLDLGIAHFYYYSTVVAVVITMELRSQLGLQF